MTTYEAMYLMIAFATLVVLIVKKEITAPTKAAVISHN